MSKIMKQVDLFCVGDNPATMTTWLEKDSRIRVGANITLKDDEWIWKVIQVYTTEVPFDLLEMNRKWDNNNYDKHDGTSLKDRVKK